jgi:hypothetical protein
MEMLILFGVLCILLLSSKAFCAAKPARVESASISSQTLLFYGNSNNYQSLKKVYYASIVRVQFSQPVQVVRRRKGSSGWSRNTTVALGQAQSTQLFGLSRVLCTGSEAVHIYESYPLVQTGSASQLHARAGHYMFQRYFMPLGRGTGNDNAEALVGVGANEYVSILLAPRKEELPTFQPYSPGELDANNTLRCKLVFLDPEAQPKQHVYGQGSFLIGGHFVRGAVTLEHTDFDARKVFEAARGRYLKHVDHIRDQHISFDILSRILKLAKHVAHGRRGHVFSADKFHDCVHVNITAAPVARARPLANEEPDGSTKKRRSLLQNPNEASQNVLGVMNVNPNQKFDLLRPVLMLALPLLPGLVGMGYGAVGMEAQNEVMGEGVQTENVEMTREIYDQVSQALKQHLVSSVLPPLHETIADQTGESTMEMIQEYVSNDLPERLAMPIAARITEETVNQVPLKMGKKAPDHTARLLAKTLSNTLSRSLPHAIVPSLMHTVSHNPLQDYYCYYCFHMKTYCQYCTYAPSQIYYAMYYTGYFSTYYSSYYTLWMVQDMEQRARLKRQQQKK